MSLVLIVDDDPSVTDMFSRMLRLEGYEVLTAGDGQTALHLVEGRHPDGVLVDLRMPSEDGLVFLRRLRAMEAERDTPVAVITGDQLAVDETVVRELTELHATVHFKPLWMADLLRIVDELVRKPV